MGAAKGQGLIRNLFDPRRTPSTSVLWSLSEPLVLLTNKWTPLWDARFLNWKTNFINNKTSRLLILTNSKCLRLLLDFHGCFLKYEEQKLPQLWGRCQLQPCWEECVMLSFSIHESKIWICIGHFPPSSCTVILFFFLMQHILLMLMLHLCLFGHWSNFLNAIFLERSQSLQNYCAELEAAP